MRFGSHYNRVQMEKGNIGKLGEKKLLERLRSFFGRAPGIVRAFSEDCAVLSLRGRAGYLLATTDVLVEGVHFRREYVSFFDIGRKAIRINVSDISAMGGRPLFYLVSLGAPSGTLTRDIRRMYRGMSSGARQTGVALIGGNVTDSSFLFLDIMMLGEVEKDSVVLRSGAETGDRIFVSGRLGASAAGLFLLQKGFRLRANKVVAPDPEKPGRWDRSLILSHLNPPCRNGLARELASSGMLTSMIDLSDGLVPDLREICRQSRCGALLDLPAIPVARGIPDGVSAWNQKPLEFALYGGEDYELLFTVPYRKREAFLKFAKRKKAKFFEIGEIVKGSPVVRGRHRDQTLHLLKKGFEHWGS